jgi:hypothetical protein
MYGFRLSFAVFMDGDLLNSFSAASFFGELNTKFTGLNTLLYGKASLIFASNN